MFESPEKEEGPIRHKILLRPRPMPKNDLDILPQKLHRITENRPPVISNEEIPFKKEAERLLSATNNRSFLKERLDLELKFISDHLVRVTQKIGRPLEPILDLAVLILQNRTNLYTTQAVDFALEGDSFGLLKQPKKPILIRRKV